MGGIRRSEAVPRSLPCNHSEISAPVVDARRTRPVLNLRVLDRNGPIHRGLTVSLVQLACGLAAIALLSLVVPARMAFAQSGAGVAPSGSLEQSPAEIVKRYVRLDQKGARLDTMSFDVLSPYIDWKEEPAWGRVVIIQEAEIPEDYRKWDIISKLEVVIPVTFRVLGSVYLESAIFVPEEETEEVRFRVESVRNKWRIVAPMIPPHIGLRRMLNFVRDAEIHEQDAAHRSVLAALGDSLRKAK